MARLLFSLEFKVEAIRLVQERCVSIAQASRNLDPNYNVLRRRIREMSSDPSQAFPGSRQMKADELEVEKLRREVIRLRAERDN
jgi:transposase